MDMNEMIIDEKIAIIDAMSCLNRCGSKVLFLVRDGRLVAAITDGDIRRWILAGKELTAKVKEAANYNPKFLNIKYRKEAHVFMKKHAIEAVPIVNDNMEITSISLWDKSTIINSNNALDMPVVMMAGGLGTRLYPYTKILPKPLIPVGDMPISETIINQFCEFGCNEFYLIVNHKKNMIKAYFNEIPKKYQIDYIEEKKPLGTGGGVALLKGKLNKTFFLTNCDTLIDEDISNIYQLHKEAKNMITMICSAKNYTIPYGVVEVGEHGEVETMREKPNLSFFINTGCYIVEPDVISYIQPDEAVGFPEVIERVKKAGGKVGVFPISEHAWMDMGQMDELEKMRKRLEENG